MRTSRRFRRLVALTAALALTVTASLAMTAQAAESQFTLIENGESGDPLSVREIAKDCRTSVRSIQEANDLKGTSVPENTLLLIPM